MIVRQRQNAGAQGADTRGADSRGADTGSTPERKGTHRPAGPPAGAPVSLPAPAGGSARRPDGPTPVQLSRLTPTRDGRLQALAPARPSGGFGEPIGDTFGPALARLEHAGTGAGPELLWAMSGGWPDGASFRPAPAFEQATRAYRRQGGSPPLDPGDPALFRVKV
jgi:hypothetical protein